MIVSERLADATVAARLADLPAVATQVQRIVMSRQLLNG
ncbi:hypothetical protein J2S42_003504 [Catenuloplanes indicus]|uniref:Uncharacterized protein n=1 Tax=Catenuloplanes indicus TaxID=137267 RepID=A0AAE3W1N9_9ACTN|nr:hypothetical protein [Catenuloplanes indicus]